MRITSAYANKILKQLDEQKAYLLSLERSGNTYITESGKKPDMIPEYDYEKTEQTLEAIDDKIVALKHAINLSNATTVLTVDDRQMTVDMILVRMAQLNRRKNNLDTMRKMQNERVRNRYFGSDEISNVPEYTMLNFDVEKVKKDYERISREIMQMQLALDKHNQIDTFDADVEI